VTAGAGDAAGSTRHRAGEGRREGSPAGGRELEAGQRLSRRENHRPLDDVAQLAGVAGPGVGFQQIRRAVGEGRGAPAEPRRNLAREVARQERNVLDPLAQQAAGRCG
jgi:hypothetical protein